MKTNIIAFVAPKGYGKTTACNIIKEHYQAVQLNFKDALIKELKQNFPDLLEQIRLTMGMFDEKYTTIYPTDDELFQVKPPLVRTLMQNYGTEVRRGDDPNYWVMQWKLALADLDVPIVLCDDVRFVQELDAVRAYGGTLIRINRSDMQNTDTHQSETEQEGFECDYTVTTCEGNQEQFARDILEIVATITK